MCERVWTSHFHHIGFVSLGFFFSHAQFLPGRRRRRNMFFDFFHTLFHIFTFLFCIICFFWSFGWVLTWHAGLSRLPFFSLSQFLPATIRLLDWLLFSFFFCSFSFLLPFSGIFTSSSTSTNNNNNSIIHVSLFCILFFIIFFVSAFVKIDR